MSPIEIKDWKLVSIGLTTSGQWRRKFVKAVDSKGEQRELLLEL